MKINKIVSGIFVAIVFIVIVVIASNIIIFNQGDSNPYKEVIVLTRVSNTPKPQSAILRATVDKYYDNASLNQLVNELATVELMNDPVLFEQAVMKATPRVKSIKLVETYLVE